MDGFREKRQVLLLYFLTDALLFWVALTLATFFRLDTIYQADPLALQRDRLIFLALFLVSTGVSGLYRTSVISDRFDSVYYLLIGLFAAAIAKLTFAALIPVDFRVISRREIVLGVMIAAVVISLWHYVAARLMTYFKSLRTAFLVTGDPAEGRRIVRELNQQSTRGTCARFVPTAELRTTAAALVKAEKIRTDLIIALPGPDMLGELLEAGEQHFRRTFLYPALHDTLVFQHGKLLGIAGIPLIEVGGRQLPERYLVLKRATDICVAAAGLFLASPLYLAIALAVKLSSSGPVFYRQERLGRHGKPFNIIKFRSMVADAENGADYVRAGKEDARVTPVGWFIRKYKLDELPQLLNILKGDMSLIGPRPLWQDFFQQHGEESSLWERRLVVRPGLTSLSHVLGSSFGEARDFLRYDLVYISTLSFLVDLKVFVATVRIVLSGKGA